MGVGEAGGDCGMLTLTRMPLYPHLNNKLTSTSFARNQQNLFSFSKPYFVEYFGGSNSFDFFSFFFLETIFRWNSANTLDRLIATRHTVPFLFLKNINPTPIQHPTSIQLPTPIQQHPTSIQHPTPPQRSVTESHRGDRFVCGSLGYRRMGTGWSWLVAGG